MLGFIVSFMEFSIYPNLSSRHLSDIFGVMKMVIMGVMLLALHPLDSISLNSFVLLEHLAILLTSTLAINC